MLSSASLLKLFKSAIRKKPFSKSVNSIKSSLYGISPDFFNASSILSLSKKQVVNSQSKCNSRIYDCI